MNSLMSLMFSLTAMSRGQTSSIFLIRPSAPYLSRMRTIGRDCCATAICNGVFPTCENHKEIKKIWQFFDESWLTLSFAFTDAPFLSNICILILFSAMTAKCNGVARSTLLQIWFGVSLQSSSRNLRVLDPSWPAARWTKPNEAYWDRTNEKLISRCNF